eukprot:3179487-Amphidinium_carterae.2
MMPELEKKSDVLRVSGSNCNYLTSSAEIASLRVLEHQAAEVAQYIAEFAQSLKDQMAELAQSLEDQMVSDKRVSA